MPNHKLFCQRVGPRLDKSSLNYSSGGLNGRGLDKDAYITGHQPEGERNCANTGAFTGGGKMFTLSHNTTLSDVVTRNVTRNVTVSLLVTFWSAANEHSRNGVFENADLSDIDDIVGVPGFGAALSTVGWAIYDAENNCVILPNFNEYNTSGDMRSATAKTNAQRQKEFRERKKLGKVT